MWPLKRTIFNSRMTRLILYLTLFNFSVVSATVEVLRPRGVSLSKKIFYDPSQEFNCIDGSSTVPFNFVNDDYCDCEDGSDEPGTAACSNAVFHCINSGHISRNIPSSRVNDNVCDCCDGSDEFNSTIDCMNVCLELGRQAKEEQLKQKELYERGFALFQQYSIQGKQIKENNKLQLENLKTVEIEEEKIKAEKEAMKNAVEEKEKAALEVYKAEKDELMRKQEEEEMLKHQEKEKLNAQEAFEDLDLNKDKILTFQEIQQFPKFDSDKDGHVSDEEAKFFLHMKDYMGLDEFITTGWMIMKPIYQSDKEHVTESTVTDSSEEIEKEDDSYSMNEEESDDETYNPEDDNLSDEEALEDESLINDAEKPPVFPPKEVAESSQPPEHEYDEETKKIVDAANEARKVHREAVEKVDKIKEDIRRIQSDLNADFGANEEFAPLKGQCFDFEDRYYTYRFCPFDKASQIDKSGGSEVSLGKWGSWAGPEENKYSKMKYENGQMCWNGPARSVMVLLQCGLENKLLSSSEPNRCEYIFEFSTPALCSLHQNIMPAHQHEEL